MLPPLVFGLRILVLYVFYAILAKSQFFISINNPIKATCICPQFHWAVYLGMLYPEIELVYPRIPVCCGKR
jgi:hypothetical protein